MLPLSKSIIQLANEEKNRLKREKNASLALNQVTDPKTSSPPLAPTSLSLGNPERESDSAEATSGLTGTEYCTTPAKLAKVMG